MSDDVRELPAGLKIKGKTVRFERGERGRSLWTADGKQVWGHDNDWHEYTSIARIKFWTSDEESVNDACQHADLPPGYRLHRWHSQQQPGWMVSHVDDDDSKSVAVHPTAREAYLAAWAAATPPQPAALPDEIDQYNPEYWACFTGDCQHQDTIACCDSLQQQAEELWRVANEYMAELSRNLTAAEAKAVDLERQLVRLNRANTPIRDADPRIAIEQHDEGWFKYTIHGADCGPFDTWREAYAYASWVLEIDRSQQAEAERDHLQRFKDWTHARLDPTHPEGPHSKEGCRIGDRMDLFQKQRDEALARVAELEAAGTELIAALDAADGMISLRSAMDLLGAYRKLKDALTNESEARQ